jgi:hypothetical protein
MKNAITIQTFIMLGAIFFTMASCAYDQVLPYEPDPGVEVLYNQDIIPIFQNNCISSGCHNGTVAPDLRPENAYDALWTGGFINVEVPEESELYLWMTDAKGPMPPLGSNATNNATVLQWIEQGALEN